MTHTYAGVLTESHKSLCEHLETWDIPRNEVLLYITLPCAMSRTYRTVSDLPLESDECFCNNIGFMTDDTRSRGELAWFDIWTPKRLLHRHYFIKYTVGGENNDL